MRKLLRSAAGPQAKFRGETTTAFSYPQYGGEESMKAIPPNFKPEVVRLLFDWLFGLCDE